MNGERPPQQPSQNPNLPPHLPDVMPEHGPHMSGTEFGGSSTPGIPSAESHLMQAPGTEVMRPSPNSDLIGYDPVSPAERTERALGSLHMGESTVVWVPGEGYKRVTLSGLDTENGRLIYDWEDPAPPRPAGQTPQPRQPARHATVLPPSHVGPIGGVDFGPQGSQPPQETPYAQSPRVSSLRNQPPEAHPDAGPDERPSYVDMNDDLSGVDEAFAHPLVSRRPQPPRESQPEPSPSQTQPIAEVEVPPVEKLQPETVQTASDDLADQILRDEAPAVAEMDPDDRPDMTAVRRPGTQAGAAAAVEHAEKTGAAEQPSAGQPERRPRSVDDDEEAPRLDEMLPGVVVEGQEEPDFNPGGGQPRYRR